MTTPEDSEAHDPAVHLGVDITEFLAALDAGADAYEAFIDKIVRGAARVSTAMGSADVTASERVVAAYKAEADAAVRAAAIVEEMENRKARARSRTAAAVDRPARTRRTRTGSSEEDEARAEAQAAERDQRRAEAEAYRMEAARKRTGEATAPTRTRAQDESEAYRMEGARRKTEAAKNPPAPVVDHTAELAAERSAQAERVRLKTEADAKIRAIDRATAQQIRDDLANEMAAEQRAAHSRGTMAAGAAEERRVNQERMESYRSAGHTIELATTAVTAVLYESAKAAIEWQSAFTGVRRTVEGTDEQLGQLEGQLRNIAKTTPATHKEIAAVAESAGQLGIKAPDVALFTRTVTELGNATNISTQEATEGLGKLINILQVAPKQVGVLGATLAALGKTGNSTEAEILAVAQRVAAAGTIVGFTSADVLGLSAALAGLGIKAELGGSAVTREMIRIQKAVDEGGKSLTALSKATGLSSAEFTSLYRKSPAEALAAVIKAISDAQKAGGNVSGLLDTLDIKNVRDVSSLARLAGGWDFYAKQMNVAAEAQRRPLALLEISEQRFDTTAAKIQIARNQIRDFGIDLGSALLPKIGGVAQGVGKLAGVFQSLPAPIRDVAVVMAAAAAAVGLLAAATLLLQPRIARLKTSMDGAGISVLGLAKGFGIAAALIATVDFGTKGIDAWSASIDKATQRNTDIKLLRRSLLDLADTGHATGEVARKFGSNLEGLASKFQELNHASTVDKINEFEYRIPVLGKLTRNIANALGTDDPLIQVKKDISDLDKAFADLFKAGVPVDEVMKSVQIAFDAAHVSVEDFVGALPKSVEQLKDQDEAQREAAASADLHADSSQKLTQKIADGVIDVDAFGKAIKDLDVNTKDLDKATGDMADEYVKLDKAALGAGDSIREIRSAVNESLSADFGPGEAVDKYIEDWRKIQDKFKKDDGKGKGGQSKGTGADYLGLKGGSKEGGTKEGGAEAPQRTLEGDSEDAVQNRNDVRNLLKDFTDKFLATLPKDVTTPDQIQAALNAQLPAVYAGLAKQYGQSPFLDQSINQVANQPAQLAQLLSDERLKQDADKNVDFDKEFDNAKAEVAGFAKKQNKSGDPALFPASGGYLPNDVAIGQNIDQQVAVLSARLRLQGASQEDIDKRTQPLKDLKGDLSTLKESGKTATELAAQGNVLLSQILDATRGQTTSRRTLDAMSEKDANAFLKDHGVNLDRAAVDRIQGPESYVDEVLNNIIAATAKAKTDADKAKADATAASGPTGKGAEGSASGGPSGFDFPGGRAPSAPAPAPPTSPAPGAPAAARAPSAAVTPAPAPPSSQPSATTAPSGAPQPGVVQTFLNELTGGTPDGGPADINGTPVPGQDLTVRPGDADSVPASDVPALVQAPDGSLVPMTPAQRQAAVAASQGATIDPQNGDWVYTDGARVKPSGDYADPRNYATGGFISGAGGPTDDKIPAWLSNGEEVMNARATAANRPLLEALNHGVAPHFAMGGFLPPWAFHGLMARWGRNGFAGGPPLGGPIFASGVRGGAPFGPTPLGKDPGAYQAAGQRQRSLRDIAQMLEKAGLPEDMIEQMLLGTSGGSAPGYAQGGYVGNDASRTAYMPGYADGGYVSSMPGYADGGYIGPGTGSYAIPNWGAYHGPPGHMHQGQGGINIQQLASAVEAAAERGVIKGMAQVKIHGGDVHLDGYRVGTVQGRQADIAGRSQFGGIG